MRPNGPDKCKVTVQFPGSAGHFCSTLLSYQSAKEKKPDTG